MTVLGLTDVDSGVGYHRISLPLFMLPEADCYLRNFWDEEVLNKGVDVVVYNRLIKNSVEEIIKIRKKYGFKLVVDVDDYWELDSSHIAYDTYRNGLTKKLLENVKIADAVTCTHERLADKIRPYNKNVYILPNALPYDRNQFDAYKVEDEKVRFIYVGGVTHKYDVGILMNPLKRVHSDVLLRDKIRMVFCGYSDANPETKDAYDYMLSSFTCGLKLPTEIRPPSEVWSYMEFYSYGDVALIPLRETLFNGMKSNLKILEAGAKYLPCIVSNVNPYKDIPFVNYVDTQSAWYKLIKCHTNDKTYRKETGQALGEYVRENFHLDKISIERKQLYESLCNKAALTY